MRWFRRFRARRLIRAQETLLQRIKLAKKGEAQCMTVALITQSPYGRMLDGHWAQEARQWRFQRRRHEKVFLHLQARVDQLLRD